MFFVTFRLTIILSFTCVNAGGEILSQSLNQHQLQTTVDADAVHVIFKINNTIKLENRVPVRLLDNQWHTIEFQYQLGNVNLIVDKELKTILGKLRTQLIYTNNKKNKTKTTLKYTFHIYSERFVQHRFADRPGDQEQCSDFDFGQKLLGLPVSRSRLQFHHSGREHRYDGEVRSVSDDARQLFEKRSADPVAAGRPLHKRSLHATRNVYVEGEWVSCFHRTYKSVCLPIYQSPTSCGSISFNFALQHIRHWN